MSLAAEVREEIVSTVRRFVEREVVPVASALEHRNEYPHSLVERMKELGLFGATIPPEYGGLGLDVTTYAMIVEELCRGWMSLSGVLNTHLMLAFMLRTHAAPGEGTGRKMRIPGDSSRNPPRDTMKDREASVPPGVAPTRESRSFVTTADTTARNPGSHG